MGGLKEQEERERKRPSQGLLPQDHFGDSKNIWNEVMVALAPRVLPNDTTFCFSSLAPLLA